MRIRFWLPLCLPLLLQGSCKPQRDTAKKQVQLTTSPPALLTDPGGSAAPAPAPAQDLLAGVAKAIMGLKGEVHDHIGLINVAALFGFDLPFNDCGQPWITAASGSGGGFLLTVRSDHSKGTGVSCQESEANAAVSYLFRDWSVQVDSATWAPFQGSGSKQEAPAAYASIGAEAVTPSLERGRRVWTRSEASELKTAEAASEQRLPLEYKRRVPKQGRVLLPVPQGLGYGLSGQVADAKADVPALTLKAGALAEAVASVEQSCHTELVVPAGCRYHAVLTAAFVQRQSRIHAELHLAPRRVGMRGRLGSQGPCHQRYLVQADTSCGGTMGTDRQGYTAWFGASDQGFNFAQDLAAQASATSSDSAGDWDFAAMRLMPGQQNQGIPNIDWALHYFAQGDYAKQSLVFDYLEEEVTRCDLHVEVEAGAAASCAVQDKTVEVVRER